MSFSPEDAVAETVVAYLRAMVDPDIQALCPVVSFMDPMSIDEAHRVVVEVPAVATNAASPGSMTATVECGVKSQWSQPTLAADKAAHFARVAEVRDKLMPASLAAALAEYAPAGTGINYAQPRRQFATRVATGWFYSSATLQIEIYNT